MIPLPNKDGIILVKVGKLLLESGSSFFLSYHNRKGLGMLKRKDMPYVPESVILQESVISETLE